MKRSVIAGAMCGAALFTCGPLFAQSVEEIQVQDFARTDYVIAAMKEFQPAFANVISENNLTPVKDEASGKTTDPLEGPKAEFFTYYTDQFTREYGNKKNGRQPPDLKKIYDMLSRESVPLQYYYIQKNPNPLGSKHFLMKAEDKSTWTTLHEKYHPRLKKYLERFGLYDIFLVDLDGNIVYTCFKELDFTTSLVDGPYANTNIGRLFQAIKDSSDKNFTKIEEMEPYLPSYDLPARFVGAPVYEGETKTGVLIFQLPPGM